MPRAGCLLPLVLLLAGCGGSGDDPAGIALYHLERQLEGPLPEGPLTCGPQQGRCPFHEGEPDDVLRYEAHGEPALGSDDFERESARGEGQHVLVTLTPEGGLRLQALTRSIAQAGRADGRPHHFAAVVGDEIVTFGSVDPEEYPDGMRTAPGLMLALANAEEADRVARKLRGG